MDHVDDARPTVGVTKHEAESKQGTSEGAAPNRPNRKRSFQHQGGDANAKRRNSWGKGKSGDGVTPRDKRQGGGRRNRFGKDRTRASGPSDHVREGDGAAVGSMAGEGSACRQVVSPASRGIGQAARGGQHRSSRAVTTPRSAEKKSKSGGRWDRRDSRGGLENGGAKPKQKFRYGNYDAYYKYRLAGDARKNLDPRISLFRPEFFTGRACMDIGCNVGKVDIDIGSEFGYGSMLGLDIDANLITRARKNLSAYYSDSEDLTTVDTSLADNSEMLSKFPLSCLLVQGVELVTSRKPMPQPGSGDKFPYNVIFKVENFIEGTSTERFDTILCLSVTKWIHLNWGDKGVKKLFARVFASLNPGGIFILEPQPWSSYYKRSLISKDMKNNYKNIKMKPDDFCNYLLTRVGFSSVEILKEPNNTGGAVDRAKVAMAPDGLRDASQVQEADEDSRPTNNFDRRPIYKFVKAESA